MPTRTNWAQINWPRKRAAAAAAKIKATTTLATIIATSFAIVAVCWTKPVSVFIYFCGTENVGSKMQQQQQQQQQ